MEQVIGLEQLKRIQFTRSILSLLITSLLQLSLMNAAKADFTNGGFEDTYTPAGTTHDTITGWTLSGYTFNGNASNAPPTSISGINLGVAPNNPGSGTPTIPGGISDIIAAASPSQLDDYFLDGATPAPTLLLPGTGLQSALINLRFIHAPLAVAGTQSKPGSGWTKIGKQATSISQQITIQPSDIDPTDNKVHIRFIAAPVLENPLHSVSQQPFFAIQLNNITTGRIDANPLFFQWNFASQSGTPWKGLTACKVGLVGCNTSYQYTEWQSFDMSPGNAFIHVGDTIEVVVVASGCSLGGHEGHVYVDDMHTTIPSSLWVTATGPASTTPGSNVTYTYTYTNNGSVAVNNVTVIANLPQGTPPLNGSGELTAVTLAQNTTYVSNTNPPTGSCSGTAPVTCSIGTLQPGQSGTFTVTVAIPGTWVTTADTTHTSGPVNNGNYPISGDSVSTLLGPLVQTTLVAPSALSNLTANTSGMPTIAIAGTAYTGSFTCANSGAGGAPTASCDTTNLPAGLAVSQCTITPSGLVWTQPADIPANQTVTCDVSGTPSTTGSFTATVTTDSSNNANSTTNHADTIITVSAADMVATSSLPASATVGAPYTGSFTCSNNSAVAATSVSCGISGLPNGVALSSCSSSPTNNPWVDGSSLPAHEVITCTVSGTPLSAGSVTATVTTSAGNQVNTSNDTGQAPITISNTSDMAAGSSLPTIATVGIAYTGSFTCSNNSAVAATSVSCGISGLPNGVTLSSCSSSPTNNPWVDGSSLPAHEVITCTVSGTPLSAGSVTATVTTSAGNQVNTSNDTSQAPITVSNISNTSDMAAGSSLPARISVFSTYSGSFTCTNNSSVTATSVQCKISGLPNGVKLLSCSSPYRNPWTNGSSLPAHQAVTCKVSGTPNKLGRVTAIVTTSASNQTNTSNDTRPTIITTNKAPVRATLNGSRVLNSAIVCCGRPVLLNNLGGVGKTTYTVTARKGNVSCVIGHSGSQTFLKMYGRNGSCTVVGTKNGITTLPLTVRTP